jgi:hypothetical protein
MELGAPDRCITETHAQEAAPIIIVKQYRNEMLPKGREFLFLKFSSEMPTIGK